VCTLSTASRAFSRAIKLGTSRETYALPEKARKREQTPARIAVEIITRSGKTGRRPMHVAIVIGPIAAIPFPRVNQPGGAEDRQRTREPTRTGSPKKTLPLTGSPLEFGASRRS
jgi:hypothetical protein